MRRALFWIGEAIGALSIFAIPYALLWIGAALGW
jgi:hypothetical protein